MVGLRTAIAAGAILATIGAAAGQEFRLDITTTSVSKTILDPLYPIEAVYSSQITVRNNTGHRINPFRLQCWFVGTQNEVVDVVEAWVAALAPVRGVSVSRVATKGIFPVKSVKCHALDELRSAPPPAAAIGPSLETGDFGVRAAPAVSLD